MAKIKYNVEDAETRKQAKPGTYLTAIKSATLRPDPKNDIELVLTIQDGDFKGSQLWSYLNFGEASAWKLREFTDAMGMKPKGTIDTDKLSGKKVGVVVSADTWNGEYRARVNKWLDPEAMEADEEDEGEDLDDEDEDETEEEEVDYSSMSLKELVEECAARDIVLTKKQAKDKDGIIEMLELDDEAAGEGEEEEPEPEPEPAKAARGKGKAKKAEPVEEEPDEDEDEDEEETDEDEDEGEDSEDEEPEDYNEWNEDELREELESRGLNKKGSKKLMIKRLEGDDAKSGTKPF